MASLKVTALKKKAAHLLKDSDVVATTDGALWLDTPHNRAIAINHAKATKERMIVLKKRKTSK